MPFSTRKHDFSMPWNTSKKLCIFFLFCYLVRYFFFNLFLAVTNFVSNSFWLHSFKRFKKKKKKKKWKSTSIGQFQCCMITSCAHDAFCISIFFVFGLKCFILCMPFPLTNYKLFTFVIFVCLSDKFAVLCRMKNLCWLIIVIIIMKKLHQVNSGHSVSLLHILPLRKG